MGLVAARDDVPRGLPAVAGPPPHRQRLPENCRRLRKTAGSAFADRPDGDRESPRARGEGEIHFLDGGLFIWFSLFHPSYFFLSPTSPSLARERHRVRNRERASLRTAAGEQGRGAATARGINTTVLVVVEGGLQKGADGGGKVRRRQGGTPKGEDGWYWDIAGGSSGNEGRVGGRGGTVSEAKRAKGVVCSSRRGCNGGERREGMERRMIVNWKDADSRAFRDDC